MTCPICGKPTLRPLRPFCSKRCADLDLAKWFSDSYAVPSNDPNDADAVENALRNAKEEKPH